MTKDIQYHYVQNHYSQNDPLRSFDQWIYIFDFGGRRHILGLNTFTLEGKQVDLMIRHHLVKKKIPLGPLAETSLEPADLSNPNGHVTFLSHLIEFPLQLGDHVATFFLKNFNCITKHTNHPANDQINFAGKFRKNLQSERYARREASLNRRIRIAAIRDSGKVPKCDLNHGRIVRLCPIYHKDLSFDALATTYRIFRKSPRARLYSLIGIDGPLIGGRFAPPGFQQVYIAASFLSEGTT